MEYGKLGLFFSNIDGDINHRHDIGCIVCFFIIVLEYSSSIMYQSEREGSEASDCSRNLSDLSDV